MSNLSNKISQAKTLLLLKYPFFGTLASKLELIQNDDIQSFRSNGVKLEYNGEFLDLLEIFEMETVLANGAMHAALSYESRKNNRSTWLWQLATDYAINDMLFSNGFVMPLEAHYSQRFSGLYAEEIYAYLKEDILRDELEYEADNEDEIKPQDEQEEQLFDAEAKALLQAELQSGEEIAAIERFFHLLSDGKINWRDELKSAIEHFHKDNYTLLPPSKKLLYAGIYLPSCISEHFRLVVAIDGSGSIDETLLNEFLSEISHLSNIMKNYEIELLVCDDKINMHKTFYSGDILEVDLNGSGGATDFRPVFEFIQEHFNDVKLLLYFTDLEGIFPTLEPEYEVKWVSKNRTDIPFGNIVVLD